jgi:putative methionine-R-sulfoxide reductase with GAF domain
MNNTNTNTYGTLVEHAEAVLYDNTELYATLARTNAALAAHKAEREQWVADYDRKNQRAKW